LYFRIHLVSQISPFYISGNFQVMMDTDTEAETKTKQINFLGRCILEEGRNKKQKNRCMDTVVINAVEEKFKAGQGELGMFISILHWVAVEANI
jgi:hypothetical protein